MSESIQASLHLTVQENGQQKLGKQNHRGNFF